MSIIAPFRSRLVLSNTLIALLGLTLVVVVFSVLLAQRSYSIRRQDLQAQSQHLALRIEQIYRQHASFNELHREVYLTSQILRERIVVLSPERTVVVNSKHRTPFFGNAPFEYSPAAFRNVQSARQVLAGPVMGFQSPIHGTDGAKNGGAIVLIARVNDVRPDLGSLIGVIVAAAAAVFLVWVLISLYFAVFVSRPLQRLAAAAGRMARGEYDVRVPVSGPGEIGQLATRFNVMAGRIQESNQILRDFVANVSHDLRTPLTMITGFSQALLDGTAEEAEIGAAAAVINEEAGRMQRLVEGLLQLARLESGLLPLDRHPVAVRPFVAGIIERHTAGRSCPEIVNRVPDTLPPIDVDPDHLGRALGNLLDNAIEYTPRGGRVEIAAHAVDAGRIEISVADTGKGITADDLARIFERLYRGDKNRVAGSGHSGLGLAIVREIAEAHGGQVTVESAPGRGTTFRLIVPRAVQQPTRDAAPAGGRV